MVGGARMSFEDLVMKVQMSNVETADKVFAGRFSEIEERNKKIVSMNGMLQLARGYQGYFDKDGNVIHSVRQKAIQDVLNPARTKMDEAVRDMKSYVEAAEKAFREAKAKEIIETINKNISSAFPFFGGIDLRQIPFVGNLDYNALVRLGFGGILNQPYPPMEALKRVAFVTNAVKHAMDAMQSGKTVDWNSFGHTVEKLRNELKTMEDELHKQGSAGAVPGRQACLRNIEILREALTNVDKLAAEIKENKVAFKGEDMGGWHRFCDEIVASGIVRTDIQRNDGKFTKQQLDTLLDNIRSGLDNLNSQNEMDMMKLNKLGNQRSSYVQLLSSMLSTVKEARGAAVR